MSRGGKAHGRQGKSSAHVVSPSRVFCTIRFTERGTTCMSFQVIKVDILLDTSLYLWTKMAYYSEVLTVPRFQMSNNIAINKYKRYKWMQSLISKCKQSLKVIPWEFVQLCQIVFVALPDVLFWRVRTKTLASDIVQLFHLLLGFVHSLRRLNGLEIS